MARSPRNPAHRAAQHPERQVAFQLGLSAESRAAALLIAKGYRIVARRWRSPVGEIDIVARRRNTLIFVEVKARATLDDAAEAVIERQQRRIIAAAEAWLAAHPDDVELRHPLRLRAGRAEKPAASHHGGVRREQLERSFFSAAKKFCRLAADEPVRLRRRERRRRFQHRAGIERVVSPIAPFTVAMFSAASWCRRAASSALREISCVAAPCSATALAIAVVTCSISVIDAATMAHGFDRALGRALDAGDLLRDFLGRLRGLVGERLHLLRHHREALAGIAGARRLDRGVERQQIGLRGDRLNELDHGADALARRPQGLRSAPADASVVAPACRTTLVACMTWRAISWIEAVSSSDADATA